MKEPEIRPLNVAIKTIVIDGRKMTKSIFNQIEHKRCFDRNIEFIGNDWLGYIKDKDSRFLLWTHQDKLWKTSLSSYYKLKKTSEYAKFEDSEWFCKLTGIEANENDECPQLIDCISDQRKYDKLVDKVFAFLGTVREKQIFI